MSNRKRHVLENVHALAAHQSRRTPLSPAVVRRHDNALAVTGTLAKQTRRQVRDKDQLGTRCPCFSTYGEGDSFLLAATVSAEATYAFLT
jgi:hypothetical protein